MQQRHSVVLENSVAIPDGAFDPERATSSVTTITDPPYYTKQLEHVIRYGGRVEQ